MNKCTFTYTDLVDNVYREQHLSFSRFGDGEWQCLTGRTGANCDGHRYYTSLSGALKNVLWDHPQYVLGMQPLAMKQMGRFIEQWLTASNVTVPWCDADIMHDASIAGRMNELTEALEGRQIVLVAPTRIGQCKLLPYMRFHHEIPEKNCWLVHEGLKWDLARNLQCYKDPVVLYCASMMSNVLIHEMYEMFGDTITQIDCGSVFDPYVGNQNRRYHAQIIERERG